MSVDHSRDVTLGDMSAQHSVRKTHFCYATSLQGFGDGDVVHQFEKRCDENYTIMLIAEQQVDYGVGTLVNQAMKPKFGQISKFFS